SQRAIQFGGDAPDAGDDFAVVIALAMRHVHASHVHSGEHQLAELVFGLGGGPDSGYDFVSSHRLVGWRFVTPHVGGDGAAVDATALSGRPSVAAPRSTNNHPDFDTVRPQRAALTCCLQA